MTQRLSPVWAAILPSSVIAYLSTTNRGLVGDIVEKHLVDLAALGFAHAGFDLDASIAQDLRTLSGDERIGVETADEHAADAGAR